MILFDKKNPKKEIFNVFIAHRILSVFQILFVYKKNIRKISKFLKVLRTLKLNIYQSVYLSVFYAWVVKNLQNNFRAWPGFIRKVEICIFPMNSFEYSKNIKLRTTTEHVGKILFPTYMKPNFNYQSVFLIKTKAKNIAKKFKFHFSNIKN